MLENRRTDYRHRNQRTRQREILRPRARPKEKSQHPQVRFRRMLTLFSLSPRLNAAAAKINLLFTENLELPKVLSQKGKTWLCVCRLQQASLAHVLLLPGSFTVVLGFFRQIFLFKHKSCVTWIVNRTWPVIWYFFHFIFISLQLYCPTGISPMGNSAFFPGKNQLQQSRVTKPTVHAWCFSVYIIHRILTWTTASLTRTQMLMHAIAHGSVRTP